MPQRRLKYIVEGVDRASPVFGRVSKAIGVLGAAAAVVGVVQIGRKLVSGMREATKLAAAQQVQEKKLEAALQATGQASESLFQKLKQQASALQAVTDVGDETILGVQALLVQFGVAEDQVTDLAESVLDLAKTFEIDFQSAATLVAKAVAGNVGALGRYGVALDAATVKAEGAAAVLAGLQEQFGGRARAEADTYAGKIDQLSNAWGDLQEKVGDAIVRSQSIGKVIDTARGIIENFDKTVAGMEFEGVVRAGAIQFAKLALAISVTAEAAVFLAEVLPKSRGNLVRDLEQATTKQELFAAWMGTSSNEANALRDALAAASSQLRDLIADLETASGEPLALPGAGDDLEGYKENVKVVLADIVSLSEATNTAVQDGFKLTQKSMAATGTEILSLGKTINQVLRGSGVNAALSFGSTLVDAAFGADVAWKEWAKNLLRNIAEAIVQATILKAILSSTGFGTFLGFGQGGIVPGGIPGAQRGMLVPGLDRGRDSVLVAARPGEAILPPELTRFLLDAAGGAAGGQAIDLRVETNLPAAVTVLNDSVRAGSVRLTATDLAGPRNRR